MLEACTLCFQVKLDVKLIDIIIIITVLKITYAQQTLPGVLALWSA